MKNKINDYLSSKVFIVLVFLIQPIYSSAVESDKQIEFNKNPAVFCDQTMAKRYLQANAKKISKEHPYLIESKKMIVNEKTIRLFIDQNSKLVDKIIDKQDFANINFALGLIPNLKIRAALPEKLYNIIDTELESKYRYAKSGSRITPPTMVKRIKAMWEDLWNNPREDRRSAEEIADGQIGNYTKRDILISKKLIKKAYLLPLLGQVTCAEILGPIDSNCYDEVAFLYNFYNSGVGLVGKGGYRSVLDIQNYEFVLMNKEHRPHLMIAAKHIFQHFEQVVIKEHSQFKRSNLFQDLSESFQKSGMAKKNADKLMWGIVGMIGTAGPGLIERMRSAYSAPPENVFAIALIAAVLPGLDHVYSHNGLSHYSYPFEVQSNCHTGKSYNFLMAAYLARKMSMNTGHPLKSAITVFQGAKAYSALLRKKFTRNGPVNYYKIDTNGPVADVFRMDLSSYAVGAIYGANSIKDDKVSRSYSIDETILHLLNSKDSGDIKSGGFVKKLLNLAVWYAPEDSEIFKSIEHYYKALNPNEALLYNMDR